MANYVRSSDGSIVSIYEVRAAHPDKSIPDGPDHADLGFPLLVETPAPAPLPWHRVVEGPVVGNTTTWVQQPMQADEIEATLVGALDRHLDSVAQARRYNDRFTCALRAGFAGPFHAEGQAFATWMDTCNAIGYQMMVEVKAGTRPIPSVDELLAAMPAMVWPS